MVNKYYITKKTVKEYAELMHITPNHLTDTVKDVTGKTPKSFITERILLEAKNLLSYTYYDIAEIAYLLGFYNPSHFGRFFKKFEGFTPKDFRIENYREKE